MYAIFWLINTVVNLYITALLIGAVLSWLAAFGVVNMHNRFVYLVGDFVYRVNEPILAPIRRVLPNLGGVDISPLVAILVLHFTRLLVKGLLT
jgi:YggT family protein